MGAWLIVASTVTVSEPSSNVRAFSVSVTRTEIRCGPLEIARALKDVMKPGLLVGLLA